MKVRRNITMPGTTFQPKDTAIPESGGAMQDCIDVPFRTDVPYMSMEW